ncbi:MAG: TolC family protein [Gemmatimonadales bacterium]|nr:TolC family protein [Gemmatimonadales bacterium]
MTGGERRGIAALLLLAAAPSLHAQGATLRAAPAWAPDAGGAAPTVTLAEALARTEKVQPGIAQARASLLNADAAKRAAFGQWLPNVNANSSLGNLFSENARPDPITGVPVVAGSSLTSVNVGVNASLLLFTGFQRGANTRAAGAQASASEASLLNARFQARLQTTNQFFAALAAEQLLRVRAASVSRADEQVRAAVARLRAGSATRSDSLRATVQLGTARSDRAVATANLAGAEAILGQLVGADAPVKAADDSAYYRVPSPEELERFVAGAVESAPQVLTAEANVRAAEAQLTASRSQYWPTLQLTGNTSWNGNSRLNDYQLFNQRQFTLQFTWPLFNRFQREQQIAVNRTAADVASAQAADARRAVRANLAAQLAQAEAASERVAITGANVEAAREDLRVQQERYRLGASTILDVLTSQEALTTAEVNEVNARFDFLRAKAQLEALLGRSL